MEDYADHINRQYGRANLCDRILEAFQAAGKQINTYEDTQSVDEFHTRGREATRELARLAGLETGMKVLDLGSGLGGPARTLAAEFGCRVTGIDLVEEYTRAADELTRRVGLADRVAFHHGDMLDLPFEAGSFDAAWSEHTSMNIEDKPGLYRGVARVLRTGGIFALYEICAREGPLHLPVPWASDARVNFAEDAGALRRSLDEAGFAEVTWRDVTPESLSWFRGMLDAMSARGPADPPPLGLNLLMGEDTALKIRNLARNLEENRVSVVQGVYVRT